MSPLYLDLLRRIESLICETQPLLQTIQDTKPHNDFVLALKGLSHLAEMLMARKQIFGLEAWHPLHFDLPLAAPAEMLLRLHTRDGRPFAPYPFIMAFYNNRLAAEIDTILVLCALDQFAQSDLPQVSINMSASSLRDRNFIRSVVERMETMNLGRTNQVIFEIHESMSHLQMSRPVLRLLRKSGASFALDDVGLSMNDVMRLAEFEGMTDYVKLDHAAVCSHVNAPQSLNNVMSFVSNMLPDALVVAEGVQSADHAYKIYKDHPDIHFVQGLHLPDAGTFGREFKQQLINDETPVRAYKQTSQQTEFIM